MRIKMTKEQIERLLKDMNTNNVNEVTVYAENDLPTYVDFDIWEGNNFIRTLLTVEDE